MKHRLNQAGFATWELALVVLVVAVIAFAGYYVYSSNQPTINSSSNTTTGVSSVDTPSAPAVTSTAGLDQALAVLNQVDPSGSNTSDNNQLSSQANF